MSALEFVATLLDTGRVRVPPDPRPPVELNQALRELDDRLGRDLPPGRPSVVPDAGTWALTVLYRACQALVYRDIEAAAVQDTLAQPCPCKPGPDVCYSVDLSLRFLPDVLRLARGIAREDPLVAGVESILAAWPLSSVGVDGIAVAGIDAFIAHPVLARLYVDRVIEREDLARLKDPRAREIAVAALGAHPQLAVRVAAELNQEKSRAIPS